MALVVLKRSGRNDQSRCKRLVELAGGPAALPVPLPAASAHPAALACLRIDRNQESVAVGIREFVALCVGAVLDGLVQLEAAVVLCAEGFYVSHNHAVPVRPGLAP